MTSIQLCKSLPKSFINIYNYILNLKFEETPNYSFILNIIRKSLKKNNFSSYFYDWEFFDQYVLKEISSINIKIFDPPIIPINNSSSSEDEFIDIQLSNEESSSIKNVSEVSGGCICKII